MSKKIEEAADQLVKGLRGLVIAVLAAAQAKVAGDEPEDDEPADDEEGEDDEKPAKKPAKAKSKKDEEEDEPADDEEDEPADDDEEPEDCAAAVAKLIDMDKRDEAVAILKKFGAKAVKDIPEEKEAKCLKLLLAEINA